MRYFRKISGPQLYLSPMNPEDAETYCRWLNDPAVTEGLGGFSQAVSLEGERDWLRANANGYQFAIVRAEDDLLLGNCAFNCLDHRSQTAEVGIFIGEEDWRGRGYGGEALTLLVDYGFQCLNLHSVMLRVFSFNERALACYRRVGFREFGRRRECYFQNGRFWDGIYMEILRRERFPDAP